MFKRIICLVLSVLTCTGCSTMKVAEISSTNNPLSEFPEGKVLYIAVQQETCDKIAGQVNECRIPKFMKVTEYNDEKQKYALRIKETALGDTSYNPTGLLLFLGGLAVGGAAGQGMAIGNKAPFGSTTSSNNGRVGFIVNDSKVIECGVLVSLAEFDACRQKMLVAVKERNK